ncbi:hypothetical protein MBENS4_4054 [Novosphingobium sp. MBES04]|nr:hypothetical protein MBENS4_4054 [Novosphingobium sp. MBES04]
MGVNDQDWEDWSGKHTNDVEGGFDRFVAFKEVCSEALQTLPDLTRDELVEFGFGQGCYEALAKVFDTLWLTQPVSSHTPKHMTRHRSQLAVGAL